MKTQFAKPTAVACATAAIAMSLFGSDIGYAQIALPPVTVPTDPILRRTQDEVDSATRRRRKEAEQTVQETVPAADGLVDGVGNAVDESLATAGDVTANTIAAVTGLARTFVAATDPAGWTIEKDLLVLLLDDDQLALLAHGNFTIVARRELRSLGMTIVTLRDPGRATLEQAIGDLRAALPDAAIDFNHIYPFAGDEVPVSGLPPADGPIPAVAHDTLRIGMIDSAVDPQHFSLQDSVVTASDFVTLDGERPLGHGTAVASIIARSAKNKARIFSASVFFQAPNHAPGASTESLVAALDWLAGQDVDVVNMSLAGPPNKLLERVLSGLSANGLLVIAAVGNNGPSGEPLYPAAYDSVVGVTAVDRDKRVFRYANRGPQVDFSALGVNVKVADAGRSWRLESGTSMASPHAAVIIAQARRSTDLPTTALLELLASSTEDLGRKGIDPVFGHGLINLPPPQVSASRKTDSP